MTSLTSALVRASKDWAQPIAAAYASGNRAFAVELRRPGAPGTFDRDAEAFTPRAAVTYYTGPARIRPAGSSKREVGDEDIPFNVGVITIDNLSADNSAHPDWTPRADDIVVVTGDAQSLPQNLANRVFEITGVTIGGHFNIGWELEVAGAAPSREGDTT